MLSAMGEEGVLCCLWPVRTEQASQAGHVVTQLDLSPTGIGRPPFQACQ